MYNIHHTASAPGPSDAFRPRGRRRRKRVRRFLRVRLPRVEAVEPVADGRRVALGEPPIVEDRLDEARR